MNYQKELIDHFSYLTEDFAFVLVSFSDQPRAFDNFVAIYQRDELKLRMIRDRSQVFIAFSINGKNWLDKEKILEGQGITRDRFPTTDPGLWEGYDIKNQSADLREYLDLILSFIEKEGAV